MKRILLIVAGLLAINPAVASSTAFVNVNVVPMSSDTVVRGQTVIVERGLITAVGDVDTVPVPEAAIVVDGTDRFLLPGLAEMHAHVPATGSTELGRVLTLFAARGVTTIRGMLGEPGHLDLREQIVRDDVLAPRLVTSGPSLNGSSVNGAADAERKVRAQHAAGYDFIKIHPGLSSSEFAAIAATANELDMPFAGHVPVSVGVEGAIAAGIATIDHLDGYLVALLPANTDPSGGYGGFFDVLLADQLIEARIADIAARTAASGTWNVPTEALFEHRVAAITVAELQNRPEMHYMAKATVERWAETKERQQRERGFSAEVAARAIDIRRQLILALQRAGAGLLLGSDAPQVFNVPGYSLHNELEFLVAAGLTPYEALHTGTAAVAEFLGSNAGIVAQGRDADLVLLDANPLTDIRNTQRIHGVMLRGSWYSSGQLAERLAPYRRQDAQGLAPSH